MSEKGLWLTLRGIAGLFHLLSQTERKWKGWLTGHASHLKWLRPCPALLPLIHQHDTFFLWRSTFKRILDEFLSVPLSFRSVHFHCVPSPGLLACRKHSKSREWDHSASFGSVFLCILQSLSFSSSLSPSCLRERQLHKQALVIPTLPIPAVVPVSFHIPLLLLFFFSPFVSVFFPYVPHNMSLLLACPAFFCHFLSVSVWVSPKHFVWDTECGCTAV